MTRTRALKQLIRARAARTGERYTTARRHVLNNPHLAATSRPSPPAPAAAAAKVPPDRRPPVSDAKIAAKTGHGYDYWFDVLDRFDALKKGHGAAARHLYDTLGVEGWFAQSITVAYERARGVRAVNQRCDGNFEVSVSKVVTGDAAAVVKALSSARQRGRLKVSDEGLVRALGAALSAKTSKGFVIRPDGLGRFRYNWGDSAVQFYLVPKDGNKLSVVVTNMRLASAGMVEQRRAVWREMLNSLAEMLAAKSR